MIEVHASYEDLSLRMEGHAGAERNAQDHDLVCCAASILFQTLVRSCGLAHGVRVIGDAESGKASIRIDSDKVGNAAAIHRFQMCLDGLEMLEKSYPQNLRVTYS